MTYTAKDLLDKASEILMGSPSEADTQRAVALCVLAELTRTIEREEAAAPRKPVVDEVRVISAGGWIVSGVNS